MTKSKLNMADGRHIENFLKCYDSSTSWAIWSHRIISPTRPPWCGCHGDGRCLATAYWTFSSYGRLAAERVIQFGWNLVQSSKFGTQWQLHDHYKKLKFKMTDWRREAILEDVENAVTCSSMYWFGWNLCSRIPSCSRRGRRDAVAMVTAVA